MCLLSTEALLKFKFQLNPNIVIIVFSCNVTIIVNCNLPFLRLNRRLEALSMTKYGSVDSGLNRVGLAAPGTNKHAVEGSNPIWNETIKAPDFDAIR